MQIISHRGYWLDKSERNQKEAFLRSFDLGFGTETDVRDFKGRLVISHDIPKGDELLLEDVLAIMDGRNLPLAINIKSDGLSGSLKEIFEAYSHDNWFVFDMSVPDMRSYLNSGISTYSRMSEVEQMPVWLSRADGIWLDSFESEWYSSDQFAEILSKGLQVCVVSSELHQRDHLWLWDLLCEHKNAKNLMLCTDFPEAASSYIKN